MPKAGTTLTSEQRTALYKIAMQMAATNGDPSPTSVVAVESTRDEVLSVSFPGDVARGTMEPCLVIQMVGSFTALAKVPAGAPSPAGDVLTIVVDASTYLVHGLSVRTGNAPDIGTLGPVLALTGSD